MAKYTTEVLSIVRVNSSASLPLRDQIIDAEPKIFDFTYPIWEDVYRTVLNIKILRHYLRREIAHETVGLWKFYLETRLNEIMPYYNQLYLTTLEKFEASDDINLTTIFHRDITSNLLENGSGDTTVKGENYGSDFPQTPINSTEASFYASQAQKIDNTTSGKTVRDADSKGEENTTQTRKGRLGARTQGEIIEAFRRALINIDVLIINELSDLFYTLW